MTEVHIVRNRQSGQFLSRKNTWMRSLGSIFTAEFPTEDAAKAAIPKDVMCDVWKIPSLHQQLREEGPGSNQVKFKVRYRGAFLFLDGTFGLVHPTNEQDSLRLFDSMSEAADYVLTLEVNVDDVQILPSPIRNGRPR